MKLLKNLRDRVMPLQKYAVEVLIKDTSSDKYIGKVTVTTNARSRMGARKNIQYWVQLAVGKAWVVKEKRNGTK